MTEHIKPWKCMHYWTCITTSKIRLATDDFIVQHSTLYTLNLYHTHTHTHACMHAHTHTRTHTRTYHKTTERTVHYHKCPKRCTKQNHWQDIDITCALTRTLLCTQYFTNSGSSTNLKFSRTWKHWNYGREKRIQLYCGNPTFTSCDKTSKL